MGKREPTNQLKEDACSTTLKVTSSSVSTNVTVIRVFPRVNKPVFEERENDRPHLWTIINYFIDKIHINPIK